MSQVNKSLYINQPALPEFQDFEPFLKDIWNSKWLTNNGKYHQEFEKKLADYLDVPFVSLFTNGTIALIIALKALELSGEIITTPFSFVATTHAIKWIGLKPVFADIDPRSMNLSPEKVESLITERTSAILPVHIYGIPCDIDGFQRLHDKYNVKLIYDAAHAFGVFYKNKSLAREGDLSILSFHATKVFNTFEGGAIVSNNRILKEKIDFLKNFGFSGETEVVGTGINGKMNEFQAALGLVQLSNIGKYIRARERIYNSYIKHFSGLNGIQISNITEYTKSNYGYFPILINESVLGESRDSIYFRLKQNQIYGRRYFYPLISHFEPYSHYRSAHPSNLPIAELIASQIICLPIHPDMNESDVIRIKNTMLSINKS